MTVVMKCGHKVEMPREAKDAPICPQCNERRVVTVKGATPRFTGACSGPLVSK